MEITITINGKPVQATVDDAVIREAMGEKKPEKKTGYERHERGQYYFQATGGGVDVDDEIDHPVDRKRYQVGNYYTSQNVAVSNVRADNLMRNLRRFAAEHGGCGKPANAALVNSYKYDWTIEFQDGMIRPERDFPSAGSVCFKDKDTAQAAIESFRDELTWYFTEYDPMPEGWWDE